MWRWDGFTVPAGGDAAASLKQRNRLAEARGQLGDAEAKVRGAGKRAQAASDIADQAARSETTARQAARAADEAYAEARDVLAGIKEKTAALASRLAGLEEAAAAVGADVAETEALAAQTARDLEALPEDGGIRERIAELKAALGQPRAVQVERQGAPGTPARAAKRRKRRLGDIEGDSVSWLDRRRGADRQLELLEQRRQAAAEELERLSSAPARIAEQRRQLLSKTESADAKRTEAADRLATAENKAAEADKALREAASELARCREERVRAAGAVEQHTQAAGGLAATSAARLRAPPREPPRGAHRTAPGRHACGRRASCRRVPPSRVLGRRSRLGLFGVTLEIMPDLPARERVQHNPLEELRVVALNLLSPVSQNDREPEP